MTETVGVAERAFFREEFRRRTVVIALREPGVEWAVDVARELLAGECRVVLVARCAPVGPAGAGSPGSSHDAETLAAALGTGVVGRPGSSEEVAALWADLEDTGVRVVGVDGDPAVDAGSLAGRLGVFKLVVTDPDGRCGSSFASRDDLPPVDGGGSVVFDVVRAALDAGVGGVNVCRLEDLDTELFTFDGAGTLFSPDAYVRVTRIGADDLPMVEQLVARGVAEGFLRPRTRPEVIRLALDGLGARVGPQGTLAGFGALARPTGGGAVAEVTCLYTVNRYAGEGVGGRLVDALVDKARAAGVAAVFACTVSDRAAALFERCGFVAVPQDRLPAEKWVGYDPDRRARVAAHWFDIDADGAAVEEGTRP